MCVSERVREWVRDRDRDREKVRERARDSEREEVMCDADGWDGVGTVRSCLSLRVKLSHVSTLLRVS